LTSSIVNIISSFLDFGITSPLRASTFVGIQAPIPEFEGNEKEGKENQNQTTDVKDLILALQEITSRIVSRKSKWHDKLINQSAV